MDITCSKRLIANVLNRLDKVRKNGDGWMACCPAHEDKSPSLSIGEGYDGRVLLNCFAGCEYDSILNALGVSVKDLMADNSYLGNGKVKKMSMNISKVYDYQNEDSQLLYQCLRLEPKDFRIRRPDGRDGWIWDLNGTQRVLYRLPELLKSDSTDVLITEGEKDCDLAIKNGFTATTNISGGKNWRPEYNDFLKNSDVVILQDNDTTGRERIKILTANLIGVAKSIKIIDFSNILSFKGADLADYFEKHTANDLRELIESTPFTTEQSTTPFDDTQKSKRPNAPTIAHELMRSTSFIYTGTRLYRYIDGVFRRDGKRFVRQVLQEQLKNKYTKAIADEIVSYVEVANDTDHEDLILHKNLVNLKNGVFDWQAGKLSKSSSDYGFITQIPVEYSENASCPNIDNFLASTLPGDCISLAEEIFGYCLICDNRFQKAFILVGTGANGKGTFINLLEAFLGRENVSTIPLQEIDEHRFKRSELFGKLANVFADLDRRALKGTSYFKTIVAGDSIDAERKFKNSFSFRPYAKLIFSANEIPHSPDNTHAFFRRWSIIPFNNKFEGENEDVDILKKLTTPEELSGLLNKALQGLIRLSVNNGFTEPETASKAKDDYRRSSDSAYLFLKENAITGPDKYVKKAVIYDAYKSWCEKAGVRNLSNTRFNARLKDSFDVEDTQRAGIGKIWDGMGLISEDNREF